MGFNIANLVRRDMCFQQSLADQLFLGGFIGGREAATGTIVIDCRFANYGKYPIPVRHGVGQPLKNDYPTSFAASVTVGGRIEGFTPAIGCQRAHLTKADTAARRQDQVDTARQS